MKNKNDLIGIEDTLKDIDIILVEHANDVLNRVLLAKTLKKCMHR